MDRTCGICNTKTSISNSTYDVDRKKVYHLECYRSMREKDGWELREIADPRGIFTGQWVKPSWRTQGDGYCENKSLPHDTFNKIPESNTVDEEYSQNNKDNL